MKIAISQIFRFSLPIFVSNLQYSSFIFIRFNQLPKLGGLEPSSQEFHKNSVLFKVTILMPHTHLQLMITDHVNLQDK